MSTKQAKAVLQKKNKALKCSDLKILGPTQSLDVIVKKYEMIDKVAPSIFQKLKSAIFQALPILNSKDNYYPYEHLGFFKYLISAYPDLAVPKSKIKTAQSIEKIEHLIAQMSLVEKLNYNENETIDDSIELIKSMTGVNLQLTQRQLAEIEGCSPSKYSKAKARSNSKNKQAKNKSSVTPKQFVLTE
ncbi:hypothetical protein [Thalassomonas sp. M1454]|uniref:hypothetical protein n=1 Tax=Thalassomonas sp. M1454 TaxID=2594477 RepID=UPI00117D8E24|nr:hypothetical protein [Thalassomonas sp. M1454]TRX57172.1 hypothetical protein FNN08_06650 [Thalassomonas sp. M1454]